MKFKKKPVVVEAITWDELVQHGIEQCKAEGRESNIINGMPWSFSYNGHPITHERDDCYLIPTLEGTHNMTPADMLITGVKGEIYPCKLDIFEATYEAADANQKGPALEWHLDVDAVKMIHDFTKSDDGDDPYEITLSVGELRDDDGGGKEYGLRMHLTDYPEEGGVMLVAMPPVEVV